MSGKKEERLARNALYDGDTLCRLAWEGNAVQLEVMLQSGADANSKNGSFFTPLHCACEFGMISCVAVLLRYGAKIEAINKADGRTGLHWAAKNGHLTVVHFLLLKGADPDAQDINAKRPGDTFDSEVSKDSRKQIRAMLKAARSRRARSPDRSLCSLNHHKRALSKPAPRDLTSRPESREKSPPRKKSFIALTNNGSRQELISEASLQIFKSHQGSLFETKPIQRPSPKGAVPILDTFNFNNSERNNLLETVQNWFSQVTLNRSNKALSQEDSEIDTEDSSLSFSDPPQMPSPNTSITSFRASVECMLDSIDSSDSDDEHSTAEVEKESEKVLRYMPAVQLPDKQAGLYESVSRTPSEPQHYQRRQDLRPRRASVAGGSHHGFASMIPGPKKFVLRPNLPK